MASRLWKEDVQSIARLLREAWSDWQRHHPDLLAAGLGYFTLFSIGPLFVIATGLIGQLWNRPDLHAELTGQIQRFTGPAVGESILHWLDLASSVGKGKATAFSALVLLLGASRVFAQLRAAMDMIWGVPPPQRAFWREFLWSLAMNAAMVLGVTLFLLAFILADAAVALLNRTFGSYLPGFGPIRFLSIANLSVSLGLSVLLFSAAYKWVPDTRIAWTDVWPGAIITAMLFIVGKSVIGLYLAYQSFGSVYGAASSVIVIMVWIYFAAQIFFYGAEVTRLYALRFGSRRPLAAPSVAELDRRARGR